MLQNNSKDNKLEIQDLGRIPVSEISDWQKMFEKYEQVPKSVQEKILSKKD